MGRDQILMRYLLTALLVLAALSSRAAQDTRPALAPIIGTGQFSCGQFVEYEKVGPREQLDLVVQWVWGFIDAYNFRGNFGSEWHRVKYIQPPDSPTVLLYLDMHCKKHPTDTLLRGTLALVRELGGSVVYK